MDDLRLLLRPDQMGAPIEQGASGFPPTSHHPPTLLSEEGDTSNLASCSLGTVINKRASDSFEIILFSGGSFSQISPPLYLLRDRLSAL